MKMDMFSTGIALDNHCVGQPRHCVGQPRVRAVAAPGGRGVAVVKAEENSRFPSGMTTKMQQQKQEYEQEYQKKWWAHARSGRSRWSALHAATARTRRGRSRWSALHAATARTRRGRSRWSALHAAAARARRGRSRWSRGSSCEG